MANSFLLDLHSVLRWAFLLLMAYSMVDALIHWNRSDYRKSDNQLGLITVSTADLQLLIGLILYFTGAYGFKITQFASMKEIMSDTVQRFFVIEHPIGMLIAIILLHIGRVQVKKELRPKYKFRKTFWWTFVAFIIVMMMIPWPTNPLYSGRGWI